MRITYAAEVRTQLLELKLLLVFVHNFRAEENEDE